MIIAQLVKVWGNRGELIVRLYTSKPERLLELKTVYLRSPRQEEPQPYTVEWVWFHNGRWLFKFEGVDSIGEAEQLKGAYVCIPESEMVQPEEDEYFYHDLVGCSVVHADTGQPVGKVVDIQEAAGQELLVVEAPEGKELLIPFVKEICRSVDLKNKTIEVKPPEGLLELNR